MVKHIPQRASAFKIFGFFGLLFKIATKTDNVVVYGAGRCSLSIPPADLQQFAP